MRLIFAHANEEVFIYLLESIIVHRILFVNTEDSCRDRYFLSDFCQNLKVRTFSSIYGDNCTGGNLVIM